MGTRTFQFRVRFAELIAGVVIGLLFAALTDSGPRVVARVETRLDTVPSFDTSYCKPASERSEQ